MGGREFFKKLKDNISSSDKREQWAWCIYDVAKSPYESGLLVFMGPYITFLAQKQACLTQSTDCYWCDEAEQCLNTYLPSNHTIMTDCNADACRKNHLPECCTTGQFVEFLGVEIAFSAFFSFTVAAAVILQIVLLPFFGAIGDMYPPKKFLIGATSIASASLIACLATNHSQLYWLAALLYLISTVCYGICSVFYNATLVYITYPHERDTVSAHGFAVGYTGTVVYLVISFALYYTHQTPTMVTYLIALAGVWWFAWAIIPFVFVHSSSPKDPIGEEATLKPKTPPQRSGLGVFATAKRNIVAAVVVLKRIPHTALFLIAASIYNDGISTLGSQGAVYATEVVHATATDLLISVFLLNVSAILGALLFNKVRIWLNSTKIAIIIGLFIYVALVIYRYFMTRNWEIYMTGFIAGFGLSGTQSLSRSLLSQIIPKNYESEIFAFYEITNKGTSWIGPIIYGAIVTAYDNDHRPANLAMLVFLVGGGVLLCFVNVAKAQEQAAGISEKGVGEVDISKE